MFKIVFIQRQFSHYRKAIFDELNKKYNIYLLYGGVDKSIVEASAPYAIKVKYIKYWKKKTNVFLFVFHKLIKIDPDIIVHEANPSILSLLFVFIYCWVANKKLVLWGHGYNRETEFNPYSNIKSKIRLYFMKLADAVILYDHATKDILKNYLPQNKLFVAQNTLDTKNLLKLRDILEIKGKTQVKKEVNFNADYNIIFIGRLLPEKKPFEAVKVLEIIVREYNDIDVNLHIIGEGPEFGRIFSYLVKNNLQSKVILYGGIYDDYKIGKLMFASDILINPGYVGLNVNQAYCFNLPVFTFIQGKNGPFHSPEIEFIIDGQTGFLCKPNDYDEMAVKIVTYLKSDSLKHYIISNIRNMADNIITIENMINGFVECFTSLKIKKNEK